ncbi:hypothetical protein D5S18_15630 [Nocardia panacis]|uniref:Uncharacterized protein n=1 Tax=Nocardia panacis TaxID=2340916 RepID=A0A3A4JWG2_9NOCA|nr:hypothetical protein [Nocardia panacis]RJO74859.1 hypothetical protein D5S18_15630 [Nocardia panacis]
MRQLPAIEDVNEYLREHGWIFTGTWRTAQVWSLRSFDVLVPASDTLGDTPRRLRELVQCIADAEERPSATVWRDLAAPGLDTISYLTAAEAGPVALPLRAYTMHAVHELITLTAHAALNESSATAAEVEPDPVAALLAQSVTSPRVDVPGLDIGLPNDPCHPDPLGRRTAARLLRNATLLYRTTATLERDDGEHTESPDISSEERKALAALAGPGHTATFILEFHWSWRLPRRDERLEIPPEACMRHLHQAENDTEQLSARVAGVVEGLVVGLSDEPGNARWRVTIRGPLVIDGVTTGRPRLVTVRLGDADSYEAALTAHRSGRPVRVEGDVDRSRRVPEIDAATDSFTVFAPDSSSTERRQDTDGRRPIDPE